MHSKLAWIAVAVAVAVIAAVAIVIGQFWSTLGAAEISPVGWLAMGFGILVTAALGIGLTALMFFSSRHGYDDVGRDDAADATPISRANHEDSSEIGAERGERNP